MARLSVTKSGKDAQRDITALCGPWGRVSKSKAISDIKLGVNHYYVKQPGTSATDVIVKGQPPHEYLSTVADGQTDNNLDSLADC